MSEDLDPIRRLLLARLIRERRMSRGWTIEDSSRAASISRQTWRNVESGQPVRDAKLGQMEQALDWRTGSILDILTGRADQPRSSEVVPDDALPVGTGVDPLDLSELRPEDREYMLGLYERLRIKRGE